MSWNVYRLVYQAKSPIHIGWHTLGYINLTRYYIPGRTMWGAFVANLTRTYGDKGIEDYKTFEVLLTKDVLVSYFYPALEPEKPMLPKFTSGGLFYGDLPAHAFERQFVKSFGQTAVAPGSNTAQDQSIHESEYIAPVIKAEDGSQSQVYFVGYVFINDHAGINGKPVGWEGNSINLKRAVSEIFVGGDRTYGWGRLVIDDRFTEANPTKFFNAMEFLPSDDKSLVWFPGDIPGPIPAHVSVSSGLALKGDIEPLAGREWSARGPGQTIVSLNNTLCWMPGSILTEDQPQKRTFAIGSCGILTSGADDVSEPSQP
ncbi:MAG: hypothetical protein A4E62_00836 [Syntrophorhabdus sp. PtaU1.Bin002]|nr:MAG: hypothetical protein A4E62_00836 [Syntrophorhabdus sp. PtaU1.Bin002]